MFCRTLEKSMSYNGYIVDYQKYVLQRYVFGTASLKISPFSTAVINIGTSENLISNVSDLKGSLNTTHSEASLSTKIFDESLELLKIRIEQHNAITDSRGKSENLYSLATLTKDEVFVIALRKAQP